LFRRIAHDEIGFGPFLLLSVDVLVDGTQRRFIGDLFAGGGVFLFGGAVPLNNGVAVFVFGGDSLLPGNQCVGFYDVVEVADDGDGGLGVTAGAEVPLEVADPEDEVGDDGGAGVEFEAKELVGVYGEASVFEGLLGFSEGVEGFENFAFKSLHVFEGDVEEVPGAAGGVEDAGVAELFVEGAGGFDSGGAISGVDVLGDDGEGVAPVVAEGFDEGGDDQPLDVGAGSVVSSVMR
jgi:hypothetical protein